MGNAQDKLSGAINTFRVIIEGVLSDCSNWKRFIRGGQSLTPACSKRKYFYGDILYEMI